MARRNSNQSSSTPAVTRTQTVPPQSGGLSGENSGPEFPSASEVAPAGVTFVGAASVADTSPEVVAGSKAPADAPLTEIATSDDATAVMLEVPIAASSPTGYASTGLKDLSRANARTLRRIAEALAGDGITVGGKLVQDSNDALAWMLGQIAERAAE